MPNYFTTGRKIRIILTARGLTQSDLAEKIGVDQAVVSLICNGKVSPTPDQLEAIKAILSWPPDADTAFAILSGDGDESKEE